MCENVALLSRLLVIVPSFDFFVLIWKFASTTNQDLLRIFPLTSRISYISSLSRFIGIGKHNHRHCQGHALL